MKTLKEVEQALRAERILLMDCVGDPKEYAKQLSTINMVCDAGRYLETSPRASFVMAQLEEIEAKLHKIENGFDEWLLHTHGVSDQTQKPPIRIKELKKEYNALFDRAKLKKQKRFLTYLIS